MISSKSFDLAVKLYTKTLANEITWSQSVDDDVFQISYPNFTIKIFERTSYNDSIDIVLQIFNENAVLVEEITDVDITNFKGYNDDRAFKFMRKLLNQARAQAIGVESVIDNILSTLDSTSGDTTIDEIPF